MRKLFSIIFIFALSLVLAQYTVAQTNDQNIPDRDGVYDVPGHPNLKVRVFVHNPKNPVVVNQCAADIDSNSFVGATGWHLPGTWQYELNVDSAPTGVDLTTVAGNAFTQWMNATNHVSISKLGNTTISRKGLDYHNIIAWGRTNGTALAVTYTWYNTSTHEAVDTDTIMNKKYAWTWSTSTCDPNRYDAQDILTHETGHWMGLDDEYASNFVNNTMYGYGSKGEIYKDTLTTGDVNGIHAIYGP